MAIKLEETGKMGKSVSPKWNADKTKKIYKEIVGNNEMMH
jgi:hypothetical protein